MANDGVARQATSQKSGWYHGWNIVAVCFLTGMAGSALPTNGFSLFLPDWSRDLHVPFSTLTLGITVFGLGCAALSPFIGWATDRFPARAILAVGMGGMAIFCIGISYITAIWQFLLLYALLLPVAVLASTTIPTNAVVMRWFVRRLGLALGITSMGLSIAGIVLPPVVAALLPDLGWRMIWRIAGIFMAAVLLPAVLLVIRERPAGRNGTYYLTADGAPAAGHHAHAAGGASSLRWRDILARRNFWLLVVAYLAMLIMYGGAGYNLTPIATSRGFTEQISGYLLSAWALSQAAATLLSGIASDKFGNRIPLAALAFLTALGGLAVALGHGFPVLIVGALLVGVGGGFWPLIASALAAEYGAAGFGRAYGALMLFLPLGSTPAFLVAESKEATGSYVMVLLAFAAVAAIGGVCCLLMREKRGGHTTPDEKAEVEAVAPLV